MFTDQKITLLLTKVVGGTSISLPKQYADPLHHESDCLTND